MLIVSQSLISFSKNVDSDVVVLTVNYTSDIGDSFVGQVNASDAVLAIQALSRGRTAWNEEDIYDYYSIDIPV